MEIRHVLVADADPVGDAHARAALASLHVEAVTSAPALLERVVGSAFDLVLLDPALGAKYPVVFWKRYGEGRTETEIARELGLSVAAVKTRAFRGRQAALRAVAP